MKNKKVSLFLDSGAFSAWSKNVSIDIQEYISFIKENIGMLDHYAVLDDITDPKKTLKNQKIMERAGLNPIPCFHYGEDRKYLQYYVEHYEYIALGGMVPISTNPLRVWLDELFTNYLCDESGTPKVKVHGFGLTSIPLLIRYPWYSVDSTSWIMTGRFGAVFVPKKKNGTYDYTIIPHKINISNDSSKKKIQGQHMYSFSSMEQKEIKEYFSLCGFEEAELADDYKKRDALNIHYFLELEKNLPQWPWNFASKNKSLGLLI